MQIVCRKNLRDEEHSTFVAGKMRFAQLVFVPRVRRKHGPELQENPRPSEEPHETEFICACRGRPDRLGTGLCSTEPNPTQPACADSRSARAEPAGPRCQR